MEASSHAHQDDQQQFLWVGLRAWCAVLGGHRKSFAKEGLKRWHRKAGKGSMEQKRRASSRYEVQFVLYTGATPLCLMEHKISSMSTMMTIDQQQFCKWECTCCMQFQVGRGKLCEGGAQKVTRKGRKRLNAAKNGGLIWEWGPVCVIHMSNTFMPYEAQIFFHAH